MATRIREKAAKRNAERPRSAKAIARYVRISPDKVRIVLDVIRGMKYTDALAVLQNTRKAACEPLVKLLNSAAANAENNFQPAMAKSDLYVAKCFADGGPILKRITPKAKGSAGRINKRTSHITIILEEKA